MGKELVLFESEQDLIEKIAYYLSLEEERRMIAQNGYEKVKTEYTYQRQLARMFKMYQDAQEENGNR